LGSSESRWRRSSSGERRRGERSGPAALGEERALLEEEMEGEVASLPWQSSLQ